MPLGSVGYENAGNENGERYIWLEPNADSATRRELQRRHSAAGGASRVAVKTRARDTPLTAT